MTYDDSNIFARILRGEISAKKIYEDDHVLAFYDVYPKKKIHALIVPKGRYADAQEFFTTASDVEITSLMRAVPKVVQALGLEENGYRLITNCRDHGGQEVPHLHFHILGGETVGKMVE